MHILYFEFILFRTRILSPSQDPKSLCKIIEFYFIACPLHIKSILITNLKYGEESATNNFIVFLIDIALMSQPKNSCYSVGKLFTVFRKSKFKLFQIPLHNHHITHECHSSMIRNNAYFLKRRKEKGRFEQKVQIYHYLATENLSNLYSNTIKDEKSDWRWKKRDLK